MTHRTRYPSSNRCAGCRRPLGNAADQVDLWTTLGQRRHWHSTCLSALTGGSQPDYPRAA